MKFTKEEIQKIILMALVLIGVLYVYFNILIGGISENEARRQKLIDGLEPKITEAKKQIRKTAELEKQAASVSESLDEIRGMIPEGAPIAWFPPKMAEYFKRQGVEKVTTALNSELPGAELEGFRRISWTIGIPRVEFAKLGIALAGLENEMPLLEVQRVQIGLIKEDPKYQSATLTVVTIVK